MRVHCNWKGYTGSKNLCNLHNKILKLYHTKFSIKSLFFSLKMEWFLRSVFEERHRHFHIVRNHFFKKNPSISKRIIHSYTFQYSIDIVDSTVLEKITIGLFC